jgi:ribonuclease HII
MLVLFAWRAGGFAPGEAANARHIPGRGLFPKGAQASRTVATAAILAKIDRDRLPRALTGLPFT